MLILHTFEKLGYTAFIGSNGNKFIFNIQPSDEPKCCGGYPNLNYICRVKGLLLDERKILIDKAEKIMGKTIKENLEL